MQLRRAFGLPNRAPLRVKQERLGAGVGEAWECLPSHHHYLHMTRLQGGHLFRLCSGVGDNDTDRVEGADSGKCHHTQLGAVKLRRSAPDC